MNEWRQIKFYDLVLKAALALLGVYIFIICLFRNNYKEFKAESIIIGVDSLVFVVSILLGYYSMSAYTGSNKVERAGDLLYIAGMITLVVAGTLLVLSGK